MRVLTALFLLTAFAVPDRPAPPDAATNDLARLDGIWAVVSYEWDGGRLADADVPDYPKLIMKNGTWRWDNSATVGTMTVDPVHHPKAVDFKHGDGGFKGRLQLGIYEIQGDIFRDCIAPHGKERPRTFAVPQGSGNVMLVFRRVKQ